MFKPWKPTKVEIESWLKIKDMEFGQKDNKNLKLIPHKYLDKYIFSDLHEAFFCDFPHVARVDIELEIKPPDKSDQTAGVEFCRDLIVTTS
jgi:hypothetical protein